MGIAATGIAVKFNLWATILALGVCHGVAFSFAYAQAIEAAMTVKKILSPVGSHFGF